MQDSDATKTVDISRRKLLKRGAAAVGLAAGSGAVTGFPTIWAQNIKDITIVHMGQAFTAIPAIGEQASKDLGFKVEIQTVDGNTQMNRLFTQADSFDITDVSVTQMADLVGRQIGQPIPLSKYKWWDNTVPLFTKNEYPDGRKATTQGINPYSVQYYDSADGGKISPTPTEFLASTPLVYNADTLGIRPDLIGRSIKSWGELFNPEFKGKTSTCDQPEVGIVDSALAFEARGEVKYGDKGNMTRAEIDQTIDRLIALKKAGHFRSFWTNFDESVNLMASGEVVIQSMISPAVTEVRARNIPCDFVPLKEGYRGWAIVQVVMKQLTGMRLDAAIEYLNWMASGWQGAFIARQGYYSSVPETVKKFLTPAEWDYWYAGKPATVDILDPFGKVMEHAGRVRDGGAFWDRMGNLAMWNCLMTESRYMNKRWNEFISA